MAGGGAGATPQMHRLRPWGFPAVSPSHPNVFPHQGIQRITVEISEESLKLTPSRPTPERIVIGKRPVGVPLSELENGKPSPVVAGEG